MKHVKKKKNRVECVKIRKSSVVWINRTFSLLFCLNYRQISLLYLYYSRAFHSASSIKFLKRISYSSCAFFFFEKFQILIFLKTFMQFQKWEIVEMGIPNNKSVFNIKFFLHVLNFPFFCSARNFLFAREFHMEKWQQLKFLCFVSTRDLDGK